MFEDDYIIRLFKQVADFVARIAGRRRSGDLDAAIAEAGRAWEEVLGHPRELVDVVDSPTLASILREPARMRLAAQLLTEEARVHEAKSDPARASQCYRRAFELYVEARTLSPSSEDDDAISELARLVPAAQLDERYTRGA